VPPGHAVIATADGVRTVRYWKPQLRPDGAASLREEIEEYRALLDAAVKFRLDSSGRAAAHLSSGWDSNAITATAARLAGGPTIVALTAAPLPGDWPVPRGRVADESRSAAAAATFYGIDHRIIRPQVRMSDRIRKQVRFAQDPGGNLINSGWLAAIDEEARASGATVILSGDLGNHGLNAGGLSALAAIRRRHGVLPWLKEAVANARRPNVRWTGILYNSFGTQLPRPVRDVLRRGFHDQHRPQEFGFVRHDAIKSFPPEPMPDGWNEPDPNKARWQAFESVDPGLWRKGALAEHGIETRDPTADRRVIEFALKLGPERFLSDGIDRPLARAALSDRVCPSILASSVRGAQAADWPAAIDVAGLHGLCEEVSSSETVRWLIDANAVHTALDELRPMDAFRFSNYDRYASYLPAALATALFIFEAERSGLR
jgi:asparagine synthase (glutamine-hydrolysing)